MGIVVHDIETLRGPDAVKGGWDNPFDMGFGTAVAYVYDKDQYYFFGADQKDMMIRCLEGKTVVSFNGVRFDNRVLLGNNYLNNPNPIWKDIDLLLEVVLAKFECANLSDAEAMMGQRKVHDGTINLTGLAEGTLGMKKTGSGAHAPVLIAQEKWAEVFCYNLHDVRLTRKLYDHARAYGFLIDKAGTKIMLPRLHVPDTSAQTSLPLSVRVPQVNE